MKLVNQLIQIAEISREYDGGLLCTEAGRLLPPPKSACYLQKEYVTAIVNLITRGTIR